MRYYGYAYAIRRSTRICDAVFDHDQTFYDHAYYADNMRCGMRSDVLRSDVFTTLYADMRVYDRTFVRGYAGMRSDALRGYASIRSDVCTRICDQTFLREYSIRCLRVIFFLSSSVRAGIEPGRPRISGQI